MLCLYFNWSGSPTCGKRINALSQLGGDRKQNFSVNQGWSKYRNGDEVFGSFALWLSYRALLFTSHLGLNDGDAASVSVVSTLFLCLTRACNYLAAIGESQKKKIVAE